MREMKFLSPSSLSKFEENPVEFYLTYLADAKAPRFPQTEPMAVGSSFDAYCKAELYNRAYGNNDPKYTFEALFDSQVEPQNRDFGLKAGRYVYDSYIKSGAFDELDALLKASQCAPQFEFKVEGLIDGVPLLGKPDCRFIHNSGLHIIFDWKVNGFCSRHATSPCKRYRLVRDGWGAEQAPPSRGAGRAHGEYIAKDFNGVEIDSGWLEQSSEEWADQLSTYSWLLGEDVGDESVVMAIDQIVAKPASPNPLLRVAQFRARVSANRQRELLERYRIAWNAIKSGHIFLDKPKEENDGIIEMLERQASVVADDSPESQYISQVTRVR